MEISRVAHNQFDIEEVIEKKIKLATMQRAIEEFIQHPITCFATDKELVTLFI